MTASTPSSNVKPNRTVRPIDSLHAPQRRGKPRAMRTTAVALAFGNGVGSEDLSAPSPQGKDADSGGVTIRQREAGHR